MTSTTTPSPAPGSTPPAEPVSFVDRYFGITAAGSTMPREIRAGVTTFLAMSYIIFVNPSVLGDAITIEGVDPGAIFNQLVIVTCLAAAFGTLVMGVVARYPFAQAPGMGLNAFFSYTVVLQLGFSWQTALGAVFLSGVLFIVLSVIGVRKAIVQALPMALKLAITAGIGAFLCFIGLRNAGIVVANEATLVGLGPWHTDAGPNWPVVLAIVGLLLTAALIKLRVTGAILIGIVVTSVVAIIARLPVYSGADGLVPFAGFSGGVVALPSWPSDLAFQLDIGAALGLGVFGVVFTFFFVDFFDATGTLTGLAQRSGYLDAKGEMPRAKTVFSMDGLAAIFGALMGTSTTTAYVESAAGVEEGGRTGMTSVVTGGLFVLAMFFFPIVGAVPSAATAPALVLVGALMMEGVKDIEWKDIAIALPAFLTVLMMPLTFSIANGVAFGIIAFAAIKVFSGRVKEAHWLVYGLAVLMLVRYIWLD